MGVFDSKNFNSEVFGKYLETVPRIKQNALLKAGILRPRNELKALLTEQTGGNYITVPMTGLIGGDALNYDGSTDITATGIDTYLQSMIVVGRAKGWKEKDFTQDITGKNFMEEIAKQVANYWDDVQQATLISILTGIFGISSSNGGTFADDHTFDVTALSDNKVGATTLNNALQKAVGANKNIFKVAIMHSQVATNLENLQLLEYAKGVDGSAMTKDMSMGIWNGRTVFVDDDVPFDEGTGTYTTYLLGEGAFDYVDIGAKTPNETFRDPLKNGGEDILITRQRKLYAPRGISFNQPSSPIVSPTATQLETSARWGLVKNTAGGFINHKAIPIAQIKSLG